MKLTRRTLLIILAVAFVAIVIFRLFTRGSSSEDKLSTTNQALIVRAEKVTIGEIIDEIKISGTIRPNNEVEIYPKIRGRVIDLKYNVGDKVKAGDILAVIEHQEIALQKKSAQASLAMAVTNHNAARTDLERARELFEERAMTKAELEAIEQKYDVARAQALSAEAQADIATQQLRNANITSLISGTVTKRTTALGANVSPETPIFAVQDLSKLKLTTSVDAPTSIRLAKGMMALLAVNELGINVSGRIVFVSPSLDKESRRAEVEIEIDDKQNQLLPNMFIDGSLILNKLTGILIAPNRALDMTDASSPRVFRINDGKIESVYPRIGLSDAKNSQILEGLTEGDVIAVSSLDRLSDGIVVTAEMAK